MMRMTIDHALHDIHNPGIFGMLTHNLQWLILLHCDPPDIRGKRQTFLIKYTNYIDLFAAKSSNDKIKEILNLT